MRRYERVERRLAAGLLLGGRLRRIAASMCEQRSYLPGDVEWTSMPKEHCPEGTSLTEPTEESCGTCRRQWASRRLRGVSGLPGELAEEMGGAKYSYHPQEITDAGVSCLPNDESGLNETRPGNCSPEEYDRMAARVAAEFIADDDAMYRHDPKHHHRPLGGKWWRTESGWSQADSDVPGPKPKGQG